MNEEQIVLRACDVRDDWHWRWILEEDQGQFLADHLVTIDPEKQQEAEALRDLPSYLERYSPPDQRVSEELRLLTELGLWMRRHVLGTSIVQRIIERAPVTVRVIFPPNAAALLTLPLEVIRTGKDDGKNASLALQDVTFVYQVDGEESPRRARAIGRTLRILALFSLPPAEQPLNLRRERQMLRRLVSDLVGASGKAIELRVLQYGATRESLEAALQEGDGWDVLHFSGHGLAGALVFEQADGTPDLISAIDLTQLLLLSRSRLKLVTLSACSSAALTIERTRGLLNIRSSQLMSKKSDRAIDGDTPQRMTSLARALVQRLDCAVLAMRYSVDDEFAITFADALFRGLFDYEQPLPLAVARARRAVLRDKDEFATGVLSVAGPALFGRNATALI
jgi:hypothetical protein